jgi:acyl carrier protein
MDAFEVVRDAVVHVLNDEGVKSDHITPTTRLVDDLAMDSLTFVELSIELERVLGVREFPMQAWVDAEDELATDRYTVGSLVQRVRGLSE